MRPSRTGYRVRGARGYRLDRVRCAAVLSDHAWSHAGRRRADVKQTHREGRESVSGDLRGNAFCGYSRGVCADSSPAARPRQRLHATRHYRPVYDTIAGLRFSVIVTSRPTWRRYVVFPGYERDFPEPLPRAPTGEYTETRSGHTATDRVPTTETSIFADRFL